MNWNNYFFYAIVLTGLTGSIWTVLWLAVSQIAKVYKNAPIMYNYYKLIMMGYTVPFVFLIEMLYQRMAECTTGFLFLATPYMDAVFKCVSLIGLWGAALCFLLVLLQIGEFYWKYRKRIPVLLETKQVLQQVCASLNIKTEIRVCRNYKVASPFIFGIRKPCIYLPVYKFSEEELEMIFFHELIHYKQGDVFWKPFSSMLICIYWYNPLAWIAVRQFQKWSEASCDAKCCEGRFSGKRYFQMIYNLQENTSQTGIRLAPGWFNSKNELKWRVKHMKLQKTNIKKKVAVAMIAAVTMAGCVSTYGAEQGLHKAYDKAYMETMVAIEMPDQTAENEVYVMDLDDLEGIEFVDAEEDSGIRPYSTESINWTVAANTATRGTAFYSNSGDTVTVAVTIQPSNKEVKVGIVSNGSFYYVKGTGKISHIFTVPQSGSCRVCIMNENTTAITATGHYTY